MNVCVLMGVIDRAWRGSRERDLNWDSEHEITKRSTGSVAETHTQKSYAAYGYHQTQSTATAVEPPKFPLHVFDLCSQ